MVFPIVVYVLVTAAGVCGLGYWFWSLIQKSAVNGQQSVPSPIFREHPMLTFSIAFFLGYFGVEAILYFLAVVRLFTPVTVLVAGTALTGFGLWHLATRRLRSPKIKRPVEIVALFIVLAFVLFWNFYPTYDVDSLAHYFAAVQTYLKDGGKVFSPFDDIRYSFTLGENMIYSLGFAVAPQSTLFAQLFHGAAKIAAVCGVYGVVRSLGLKVEALIAALLMMSEEHFIASGANKSVHINVPFMFGIFAVYFGSILYIWQREKPYLILAFFGALWAVLAKYVGLYYLGIFILIAGVAAFLHGHVRRDIIFLGKNRIVTGILAASLAAAFLPYLSNWIQTGTPVFPARIGPLASPLYDAAVLEVSKLWHYNLGIADALKNVSGFLVWPGVLASKILLPLALGTALVQMMLKQVPGRLFIAGMVMFVASLLVVLLQETVFVYEMRYYRFGMMLYALTCALLIANTVDVTFERMHRFKFLKTAFLWVVFAFLAHFSFEYSFDAMLESRPSAKKIWAFVTGETKEADIFKAYYPEAERLSGILKESKIDRTKLVLLTPFSWPQFVYPLEERGITFLKTAALPSEAFFNPGLFAAKLTELDARYVLNTIGGEDYPLGGQAIFKIMSYCGQPVANVPQLLELEPRCLVDFASNADAAEGRAELEAALTRLRQQPEYDPFNKPTYGGVGGVLF